MSHLHNETAEIETERSFCFYSLCLATSDREAVTAALAVEPGLRLPPAQTPELPGQRLIGQNLLISNLELDNVTHPP